MASRIKTHHVIRDHDKGTVYEHIEIETGQSVQPDSTTPQAEAILKAESIHKQADQVKDITDTLFGGMDAMFENMGKMFNNMESIFDGKTVKSRTVKYTKTTEKKP